MALTAVQRGALKVGQSLKSIGESFRSTVRSTVSLGNDTISRTREKIKSNTKSVARENKKQKNIDKKSKEYLKNKQREDVIEGKGGVVKKAPLTLKKALIDKPMSFMTFMTLAWIAKNGPKIFKDIEIMTKKVRIFMATIKRIPGRVWSTIKATVKFASVFLQNVLNLDFEDRDKKIRAAKEEFDLDIAETKVTFAELKNVWGRDEEELDKMLADLDKDTTVKEVLDSMGVTDTVVEVEAQNPIVGSQPESGERGEGATRLTVVHKQALEKISQYESAGSGGYNAMNQGTVPDKNGTAPKSGPSKKIIGKNLTDMTVGEVIAAQNKKLSNTEGFIHAAGKYQFIGNTLPGVVESAGIPLNSKFSPEIQDQLAVTLMKQRGAAPWLADKRTGLLEDKAGIALIEKAGKTPLLAEPKASPAPAATDSPAPTKQVPQPAAGSGQLVNKVSNKDMSLTASEGGKGAVGKTDIYDPSGRINGRGRPHLGVDIGTSGQKGWYVALKLNGTVSHNGWSDGGGWMLFIKSGNKEYVFMHLAKQSNLKNGTKYTAGTPIGEIGSTGRSTSEHLHYEVRVNNKQIDPSPYMNLIEIGKLKKKSNIASANITDPKRNQQVASISSKQTGGTQKQTNILTVTQKEIIMIG